jgi:two-component system NtrC family response regulator
MAGTAIRSSQAVARILIIDDDEPIRELLCAAVERMGHEAAAAGELAEAFALAREASFDAIYLDVRLPDGDGLGALPALCHGADPPEVIIITGEGDPDGAELAMRSGAWDYIEKPCSLERMTLPLARALQYRAEKRRAAPLTLRRETIIGSSPGIRDCLDQAARAAAGPADVLVIGETGTGKELFARAIHDSTPGARGPFVTVDCAALPETLVESLLFGHARGAFTGAEQARVGLVKQADAGTLFLDEVGELPLPVQAKFLRVLQERTFRPVGASVEERSRFRLVAATNRDLEALAARGAFRTDLLYRLKTVVLELPPLRGRREDLGPLVLHRLAELGRRHGQPAKGLTPEFLEALCAHSWPGNVRELFNVLETAVIAAQGEPTLFRRHLPVDLRARIAREAVADRRRSPRRPAPAPEAPTRPRPGAAGGDEGFPSWRDHRAKALAEVEQRYFSELLRRTGGDRQAACRLAGLRPARLYELLGKHGLLGPR